MMRRRGTRKWIRWGLFNYHFLWSIHHTRKDAKQKGAEIFIGGNSEFDGAYKDGSMRIARVEIRELPRQKEKIK